MSPLYTENLSHRLGRLPMLKVLLPVVVGILLADVVALPLWGVAIGFVVCAGMGIVLRGRGVADVYIVVALLLAGMLGAEVRGAFSTLPTTRTTMEIVVDNITSQRERVTLADAHLVAYASEQGTSRSRSEVRVAVSRDIDIECGTRLLVDAKPEPFAADDFYSRYMLSRGVAGEVYILRDNLLQLTHHTSLSTRLRRVAVERLHRLDLDSDNEAVTMAMTIAERRGITPELRTDYSLGGAAHLLAVSGLHIGFVCVIANILLSALILLRHGQVVRSILVVAIIWLFAAIAGFTPSVVRSAVMFTMLQFSILLASRADTLNTLCFTALAMLAWDARVLCDAGFQLSFIAVAAIVEWGVPLMPQRGCGLLKSALNWLLSGIVASAAAAIATLPLTAYLFGTVSLWSVVTGPIMVALAAVTVGAAMLWILCPIGALQGVVACIIGLATDAMNALAAWCSDVGVLAAQVRVDGWLCWAAYGIMVGVTIIVWSARRRI